MDKNRLLKVKNKLYILLGVGHKVRLGFSVTAYRKTRMNFLANPIQKKSYF